MGESLIYILELMYFIIIVGTVIVVLLENRNPVKTISWIMVLIFLPIIGLVLYLFFGKDTRKVRLISRKAMKRILGLSKHGNNIEERRRWPDRYISLISLMSKLSPHAFLYGGNSLTIQSDGTSFFLSLLLDIGQAKDHIHLEFYIIEDDPLGRLIRDVLIDKAREGVKVRVLYDGVGSWSIKKNFFKSVQCDKIETQSYLPVKFPLLTKRVNYRNHRKIVVIDGNIGYVGGMNLAYRYLRGNICGEWRDTQLRIVGEGVYGLQTVFIADWYFANGTILTEKNLHPPISNKDGAMVQIVTTQPIGEWKEMMQGYMKLFTLCKEYLYVQTPYYIPTEGIRDALCGAALSGVDVRLMIPFKSDSRLVHQVSLSYLEEIMDAGVKVYRYKGGFLHSKLLVADDSFMTVGSTNMDFRSFENNFEINAFVYDTEAATEAKQLFLEDIKKSSLMIPRKWKRRSAWKRINESVLRLLSPLL
ncbi:MAG TPA: cardiolipin synthase [Bacteroidaceae bacterium]|nr:cardiolipin synthase [Bacteroidaceae bacterium]